MKKFDISTWKEFSLKSLGFTSYHGKRIKKSDRIDGNIIFLTAGKENRGVVGTIGNEVQLWNSPITVDMFGNAFYHDYVCSGDDNVYAFINDNLNGYVKMFIASIIDAKNKKLFSYADQFRQKDADKLSVKLPNTIDGFPDFLYMESYMKNLELVVSSSLTDLRSKKNSDISGELDISSWKSFRIIDLFTVKNTHSILKSEIVEDSGKIPYVTASNENNGVYSYVDYYDHLKEEGNCIMIGGKTLTITYQKNDFFSNDSHNLALYIKDVTFRTEEIYLFMITALRASIGHSYSWGDSISFKSIQKDYVTLPADSGGNPDYSYMVKYITGKLSETKDALSKLTVCV